MHRTGVVTTVKAVSAATRTELLLLLLLLLGDCRPGLAGDMFEEAERFELFLAIDPGVCVVLEDEEESLRVELLLILLLLFDWLALFEDEKLNVDFKKSLKLLARPPWWSLLFDEWWWWWLLLLLLFLSCAADL